jgi:REG-2-like HAD superfamily hydrolase
MVTLRTSPAVVLLDIGDTMARPDPSWHHVYATVFERYGVVADADAFGAAFRSAWSEWGHEGPFEASEEASFRRLTEFDQLVFDRLGYPDLPERFFRDVDQVFRKGSVFFVFPDVVPALQAMRMAGLRLGVVSNWGWSAPELLEDLKLAPYFEVMSISARVGYVKPHRAIFEDALRRFGVGASEAIHVGDDREADVSGAGAVGIEPVLIDRRAHTGPPPASDPSALDPPRIRDFGELLDLLSIARPRELVVAGP